MQRFILVAVLFSLYSCRTRESNNSTLDSASSCTATIRQVVVGSNGKKIFAGKSVDEAMNACTSAQGKNAYGECAEGLECQGISFCKAIVVRPVIGYSAHSGFVGNSLKSAMDLCTQNNDYDSCAGVITCKNTPFCKTTLVIPDLKTHLNLKYSFVGESAE